MSKLFGKAFSRITPNVTEPARSEETIKREVNSTFLNEVIVHSRVQRQRISPKTGSEIIDAPDFLHHSHNETMF